MSGRVVIFDRKNGFLVILTDPRNYVLLGDITGLKKEDKCYDIYRRKRFIGTIYGNIEIREDWYGDAERRVKR